jgi:hypothetical protein
MFNMDKDALLKIVMQQFAEGFDKFPPEIKQALLNTEVLILREDKQIRIVARSLVGKDEESKQVATGLGNALIPFIARMIGCFRCKVRYQA